MECWSYAVLLPLNRSPDSKHFREYIVGFCHNAIETYSRPTLNQYSKENDKESYFTRKLRSYFPTPFSWPLGYFHIFLLKGLFCNSNPNNFSRSPEVLWRLLTPHFKARLLFYIQSKTPKVTQFDS